MIAAGQNPFRLPRPLRRTPADPAEARCGPGRAGPARKPGGDPPSPPGQTRERTARIAPAGPYAG